MITKHVVLFCEYLKPSEVLLSHFYTGIRRIRKVVLENIGGGGATPLFLCVSNSGIVEQRSIVFKPTSIGSVISYSNLEVKATRQPVLLDLKSRQIYYVI